MTLAATQVNSVITTGFGRSDWDDSLNQLSADCRDVYFTSRYHELHELNGDGDAFLSVVRSGSKSLLIGGIRSRIAGSQQLTTNESLWDLEGCNGYGGPLASLNADPEFLGRAWERWKADCEAIGIVAAFFRLHPLLDNARLLPADSEIRSDRKTASIDLTSGTRGALIAASPQHRNMLSKGRREGAEVVWNNSADWNDFVSVYGDAMRALNAPMRLRFSAQYFEALRSLPGVEWAAIRQNGLLKAAAIFLFGSRWGHYHLAARTSDAPNYAANCLVQAGVERACGYGLQALHLGGGVTSAPDDRLLRFKQACGGTLVDFKVALVIINRNVYRSLCDDWTRRADTSPKWLLGYRQPQPERTESMDS